MADETPSEVTPQQASGASAGGDGGSINPRLLKILQMGGILLVPATLFGYICKLVGTDDRVIAEVAIAVFLVSTILLFASFLNRRLHVAIPACLSVVVGAVLIHLLLKPAEVRPAAPLAAEDGWVKWEQQIKGKLENCKIGARDFDTCVASAVTPDYPKDASQSASANLYDDIHAGDVLMRIDKVRQVLETRIGIMDNFLGDGFAQPHDAGNQYQKAAVPEYLVENHGQQHPGVWTYELAPSHRQLNRPLAEIFKSKGETIEEIRGRPQQELDDFLASLRLGANDATPAVVRFGIFPRKKYSGMMGLPGAKRVFVLRLGPVYNLTLNEAANLSGHSLKSEDSNDDKIWVWVYQPDSTARLESPTWGTIIPKLKSWLE